VAKGSEPLAYPADGDFHNLLRWHLFTHGTRPDNKTGQIGKVWSAKEFSKALQLHSRTVSNWLREENPTPPQDLASVERVIFGDNRLYDEWRANLRAAYNVLGKESREPAPRPDRREVVSAVPDLGIARSFRRTTSADLSPN
jgi:hypothetical protein